MLEILCSVLHFAFKCYLLLGLKTILVQSFCLSSVWSFFSREYNRDCISVAFTVSTPLAIVPFSPDVTDPKTHFVHAGKGNYRTEGADKTVNISEKLCYRYRNENSIIYLLSQKKNTENCTTKTLQNIIQLQNEYHYFHL